MATKTISVDLEAYERLTAARLDPRESFSKVIKRAKWTTQAKTGAAFSQWSAVLTEEQLDYLEAAQREDEPPRDRWAE